MQSSVAPSAPLLGQASVRKPSLGEAACSRQNIRPRSILEVVRRRGRSWGLLAQYEEMRLNAWPLV